MIVISNELPSINSTCIFPTAPFYTSVWGVTVLVVALVRTIFVFFAPSLQQIVPAHLATSPIPTEGHLLWISEVERRGAQQQHLEDDLPDPGRDMPEPPHHPSTSGTTTSTINTITTTTTTSTTTTTKKKKRRRKKHKGDPRREEPTPPMAHVAASAANMPAANAAAAPAATTPGSQTEEIFEMELSSDEELLTHASR